METCDRTRKATAQFSKSLCQARGDDDFGRQRTMNRAVRRWMVGVAIAASAHLGFSPSLRSQELHCTNFWVNPETGQEECIDSSAPLQLTPPTVEFPDADPAAYLADAKATLERRGHDFALRYVNRNEKTYLEKGYRYCRRRRNGESHSEITRDYTYSRPGTPYVPGLSTAEHRLESLSASLARKHLCPEIGR